MLREQYFTPATLKFLSDLARNNNRPWFDENKKRYEADVKEPALRFISDFGPHLEKISTHFRADPRPAGGSLYRIYRDVRFSRDKSPFKTMLGIHFRHHQRKDAHAPGFYLHIQPGHVFTGAGIWHPDAPTLKKIRDRIAADPAAWKGSRDANSFRNRYELAGDALARPPRGYDANDPMIDDLKRKDFVGIAMLTEEDVTGSGFLEDFVALCRAGAPFQRFLCETVGVPY